jgi:hypothetical protein
MHSISCGLGSRRGSCPQQQLLLQDHAVSQCCVRAPRIERPAPLTNAAYGQQAVPASSCSTLVGRNSGSEQARYALSSAFHTNRNRGAGIIAPVD